MPISVAIVGAGPAGFYAAESLLDGEADVRVDLIERLATPYGLIRTGVAPDHQTTKRVSRRFEKTALEDAVHFYGNVELGRDVGLDELRQAYDAVVLAIGSPTDRALGIPGEHLRGVYGSGLFVGWFNGHPDFRGLDPVLDTPAACVIGNGNVALDIARVLVKTEAEMADSDLVDYAARAIRASSITDVYLLGRRGPIEAKFTNVELREMGKLDEAVPIVDAAALPAEVGALDDDRERRLKERNLASLREFAARDAGEKPKRVHFRFYSAPVEIVGDDRVRGLRVERTRVEDGRAVGTGEFETIPCGFVAAAVGYRSEPVAGLPFDEREGRVPNVDGRVADGLYAVGWTKRGPVGVIGSNKPDGEACARQIAEDIPAGAKPGRPALEALLAQRRVRVVTFDDWRAIEAAEIEAAEGGAPRRKFTSLGDMLAVLEGMERARSAG